jgi:3-oxoacyl-[acyl-carrier protein] reductase
MDTSLNGRRALVCGSSQGIGRACAEALAEASAEIILAARDETALKQAADALPHSGGRRHTYVVADFAEPEALRRKVAEHVAQTGPIQILVNNTGGPHSSSILESTAADFATTFAKHVLCNQLLVQTLLPGMKAAGFGRVVNIISTSVLIPIRGLGVSNTIRGAVANWGRSMVAELAPLGITVNNVLPGFTDTARLRSLLELKAGKLGVPLKEIEDQARAAIPAGRFARPEEIAAVVLFLALPAASYVNGVNLPVDGGRTAVQ